MSVLLIGAVFLVFALVIGVFLLVIVTGLLRWGQNNRAPLLTVPAIVLAKRQETRGGANTSVSTDYYVAFEVQGGQRIELPVDGSEFGVLVERDRGLLTHQGTRFKGFARTPQDL